MGFVMQKKGLLLSFVLMLFIIPFMDRPWLGQVWQFPDEDGLTIIHANVINSEDDDADDLSLAVSIPELGIYQRYRYFDLPDHSKLGRTMSIELYQADPSEEYFAQVFLLGEHGKILDSAFLYLNIE